MPQRGGPRNHPQIVGQPMDTVFNKEEVNVYDANNVKITVTRGAIL